jgi:hypothetical protein
MLIKEIDDEAADGLFLGLEARDLQGTWLHGRNFRRLHHIVVPYSKNRKKWKGTRGKTSVFTNMMHKVAQALLFFLFWAKWFLAGPSESAWSKSPLSSFFNIAIRGRYGVILASRVPSMLIFMCT